MVLNVFVMTDLNKNATFIGCVDLFSLIWISPITHINFSADTRNIAVNHNNTNQPAAGVMRFTKLKHKSWKNAINCACARRATTETTRYAYVIWLSCLHAYMVALCLACLHQFRGYSVSWPTATDRPAKQPTDFAVPHYFGKHTYTHTHVEISMVTV